MDVLRKKNDKIKYNNDQLLPEDEHLSPSFENAIILWALKEIDARLPNRVKKNYGHQMTGNVTLRDVQPIIFQNITSMLEELNEADTSRALASVSLEEGGHSSSLNALNYRPGNRDSRSGFRGRTQGRFPRGGRVQRGGGRGSATQPRASQQMNRPGDKFCRICNLAGSDRKIFTSHEIGNCSRLTVRDTESLRESLVLNGMITEEV